MIAAQQNHQGHHEEIVLGGILTDRTLADRYLPQLRGDLFYDKLRRAIFEAACLQHFENGEIAVQHLVDDVDGFDRETVAAAINDLREWGQDFGDDVHLKISVKALTERHSRAELQNGLRRLVGQADSPLNRPGETLAALDELTAAIRGRGTCTSATLADVLGEDPAEVSSSESIATGITAFDQAQPNGALQAGQKVGIAGGPGAGKTTFAETIAISALTTNPDLNAVWGAGEMSLKQLRNVALSIVSGLTFECLKRPYDKLSPGQVTAKREAVATLRKIGPRLTFIDPPLTVSRIEAAVASIGAQLLVVDYLQLMKCETKAQTRRDAVDYNLHELIRIANRHNCAFLLISDMPKHERGRRPDIFSAFKETSEAIYGLDSAYVLEPIGVHVPDDDDEIDTPDTIEVRLRCLKQRFGRRQSVAFRFDQPTRQFRGLRS